MDAVSIIIPSFSRWDCLPGKDYFPTARYCVPESQATEYAAAVGPQRLLVVPDEEDGNIARKRNAILKRVPRPVLMVDDDVSGLVHCEGGKGNLPLSPEQAAALITSGFDLAREWGCPLWGVNVNSDPMSYQEYKPFSLCQPVLGPLQGHLDHDLQFDARMTSKDDYDMSLQALNKHRKILRLNKFSYRCEHGTNRGGIVATRTLEREKEACRRIMAKWGRHIISYKVEGNITMQDLLNAARFSPPIAGV